MWSAAAVVFLAVSVVSLTIYVGSLLRVVGGVRGGVPAHRGLVRTATCRVVSAVLYVSVGVLAITRPAGVGVLALVVFTATQVMWQLNALADVRLRRMLPQPARGRHQR